MARDGDVDVSLTHTDFNDNTTGTTSADTLYGRLGNDVLTGENGADQLLGESGEDTLSGGAGDDILTGGQGQDQLNGGDGNDTFRFIDPLAHDVIEDFHAPHDDVTENDILKFEETGLGFTAGGISEFTTASSSDAMNPDNYKIFAVSDNAASDFSDVASLFSSVLDAGTLDNSTNEDAYFVIDNGSDARVYFWQGDTTGNQEVDDSELTRIADLTDVSDVEIMDADNFEIV